MGVSLQLKGISLNMLVKRLVVALILVPIGLGVIILGGFVYAGVIAFILGLAVWEYNQLFHASGLRPAGALLLGGTLLIVFGRALNGFESAEWIISLLVLASMTYHLLAYEKGRDLAGSDFSVTVTGVLYVGWLGAYLISLRSLPEGKWWVLLTMPTVWLIDVGAFVVGSQLGRRHFSPRLSPRKTWEGLIGGLLAGALTGTLLAAAIQPAAGPLTSISPVRGALLGVLLAVLTPLGDLGESLIKRQAGAKDSGKLLPGHGGAFDRIDSWLWAGVISYYLIVWFFI